MQNALNKMLADMCEGPQNENAPSQLECPFALRAWWVDNYRNSESRGLELPSLILCLCVLSLFPRTGWSRSVRITMSRKPPFLNSLVLETIIMKDVL